MLTGSINVHSSPIHVLYKDKQGNLQKTPLTYVFKDFAIREAKPDVHTLIPKEGFMYTLHAKNGLIIDTRNLEAVESGSDHHGNYISQLVPAKGEFRAYANKEAKMLVNEEGEETFLYCYLFREKVARATIICCDSVELRFHEEPTW